MPDELTQMEIAKLKKRVGTLEEDFEPPQDTLSQQTFNKFADFRDALKIPNRGATPATCRVGQVVEVSGTMYICSAADTWTAVGGGTPGGADTQVQFNDGGAFGGDSGLTWDKTNDKLSIGIAPTSGSLISPTGSGAQAGSALIITAGNGGATSGAGGIIDIDAGSGIAGNSAGGDVKINAGNATGTGAAGNILLVAGGSNDASIQSGLIGLTAGNAPTNGTGADVEITPGSSVGTNSTSGDLRFFLTGGIGTGKTGRVIISRVSGAGAREYTSIGLTQTTNATVTSASQITFPTMTADTSLFIEARILARRTGGTAGTDGDAAAYIRQALYQKVGAGAPTLIGAITATDIAESQAGWDCTFVVSSNDVLLQVTGAVNNNITWTYIVKYMYTG